MTESARPGNAAAYLRIAQTLREQIERGELRPQDPLAPERELCVSHGVSRMTVRRALGLLESEGLLYRDGARGTFVAEPRVQIRLGSFSAELARAGHSPSAEVIWAREEVADGVVALGLGVPKGHAVFSLRRLRRSNGEPLALENTYYRVDLLPGFLQRDLSGSLWEEMKAGYGISPARSTATLEVVVLDPEATEQLGSRSGAGGLKLTRRTENAEGLCVEFAIDIYRAERVSLVIDRTY